MRDLDEIRTFVAVAERRSVNRAAADRHLSQPAVTRQVQRLEAALGAPLFDRRRKPLALTPAGEAVLERCRALLRAAHDVEAAVGADAAPAGELRLGVAQPLSDLALAGPIDRLRRDFPRVALRVSTGWSRALLDQVRQGALDAAVLQLPVGQPVPAGVEGEALGEERLVFVASRRHAPGAVVSPGDLAGTAWVLNPEGCGVRAGLARALEAARAPLEVAVEAYGADLQLSLVARGLGLGVVPARALARSPHRRRLRTFRVRGHAFRLTLWLVRGRPPAALAPALAALEGYLRVARSRARGPRG